MTIKYIALDIDGVLRPDTKGYGKIDNECFLYFLSILEDLNCPDVYITSTWQDIHSLEWFKDNFGDAVKGFIPNDARHGEYCRYEGIIEFCRSSDILINEILALDDKRSLFPDYVGRLNLHITNGKTGLRESDYREVIKKFG